MPWWGVLLVIAVAALSAVGTLLVRRSIALPVLEAQNEVAGFIYGALGIVYGVLLGFTVIAVWDEHQLAKTRVEHEANALGDLFHDALAFPPPDRDSLLHAIDEYAHVVIDDWAAMSGGKSSPRATQAYWDLWTSYLRMEPRTQRESVWLLTSATRLNDLGDAHRLRLLSAKGKVPHTMWWVLITGACITVAFSFFFGTRNVRFHAVMVGGLAGAIALVLVLIAILEHPFAGSAEIDTAAYQEVRTSIDQFLRR